MKMGYPVRRVCDTDGHLNDGNFIPVGFDKHLHLKLIPPGTGFQVQGFRQGIDAEPTLGIPDPGTARCRDPQV